MSLNYEKEFELYASVIEIQHLLVEVHEIMAADLGLALRTVSSGLDAIKRIGDIASKTQNTELREEILNLKEQLLEMRSGMLEAKEEIAELKEKNNDLTKQIKELQGGNNEPKPRLVKGLYSFGIDFGLFCTGCYDSKKQKIRVVDMPQAMEVLGKYQCPVCNTKYKG